MAEFNDSLTFNQPITLGPLATLSFGNGAAATQSTVKYATKAFVLAQITAGLLTITNGSDIPVNAIILGAYVKTTTQPTFSAGTTTGLTAKIGTSSDDDGYGQAVSIAGTAGVKVPEPGARCNALNTTQNILVAFTPTGGTPTLAEVSAGAGTVTIAYTLPPLA